MSTVDIQQPRITKLHCDLRLYVSAKCLLHKPYTKCNQMWILIDSHNFLTIRSNCHTQVPINRYIAFFMEKRYHAKQSLYFIARPKIDLFEVPHHTGKITASYLKFSPKIHIKRFPRIFIKYWRHVSITHLRCIVVRNAVPTPNILNLMKRSSFQVKFAS